MGGTSEAHAAVDADLPPVSLAPWIRLRLVAPDERFSRTGQAGV
jgi:hypothetical protein